MEPLGNLIALTITIYIALFLTSLGFAMMFGGNRWIPNVFRFWFTAPMQWLLTSLATGLWTTLRSMVMAFVDTFNALGAAIGRHLRWVITGR